MSDLTPAENTKGKADMGKRIFAAICLLSVLLLCCCTSKETETMETKSIGTITFINSVSDADVWILADTEANRKTTLWGTATVSKITKGESRQAPLCEPGDEGLYMFRMIDTDKYYYSADRIAIKDGWTMEIKGEELHLITIEVTDGNGNPAGTYEVFAARL